MLFLRHCRESSYQNRRFAAGLVYGNLTKGFWDICGLQTHNAPQLRTWSLLVGTRRGCYEPSRGGVATPDADTQDHW
jgi:hypothetical protein